MRVKYAGLGFVVALVAATGAWAGLKAGLTVNIDTVNQEAYGSFGNVRNSADATQYIGCTVYTYSGGSESINCFARDTAGNYRSCSSFDLALVRAARSVTGDSHIYFRWDASNTCTQLTVTNGSYLAPKQL